MKNFFKLTLASIILMVSCSKDGEVIPPIADDTIFYASVEAPSTRTFADEEGKLLWTAEDMITVFCGRTIPLTYQFTGETGANYGSFSKVSSIDGDFITGNELGTNYAIYPHTDGITISNSGKINYTIPATQHYAENSFGLGANVMVAVTEDKADNYLSFKNLGGYFEFSLYGNVEIKSIEFKGNNGEKLAGKATITATNQGVPTFVFDDDATETLTLDCGNGVQLGTDAENATKFWFVVPAITYEQGITITITDVDGGVMEKSTEQSITIERSTVQPLSAFEVETVCLVIPNNQIWYTSGDGCVVEPYSAEAFDANIVSNVYKDGKGIIKFDGVVTTIGDSAFKDRDNITSITLPNSVVSIGKYAFEYCVGLPSIDIPESVTSIDEYAFYNCYNLTSVTIPSSVTEICEGVFKACAFLESVTLPNSIVSIGKEAFNDCISLTSIDIPEGVTSLGGAAFAYCPALTSVTIPNSVTHIHNSAFALCESLTSITIPESLEFLGEGVFFNCYKLSAFYGKYATTDNRCLIDEEENCLIAVAPAGLTTYAIPEGVTTIGKFALYDCAELTSITIPNSVTHIGYYSFRECRSLTSVTIPESVSFIDTGAFEGCFSLKSVYCKRITPPWGGVDLFRLNAEGRKFYVPAGSVEAYKQHDDWNIYADDIVGYDFE